NHDGVSVGNADPGGLRKLFSTPDDWRAGHGLPQAERFRFLGLPVRRPATLLKLHRRWRAFGSGIGAGCRVVCLLAFDGARILARRKHRLLDTRDYVDGRGEHFKRNQCDRHDRVHAMPWHDADQDATIRVDDAGRFLDDHSSAAATLRLPNHAVAGPFPWGPCIRHPGRRIGRPVAALLLDLRAPRSLYPCFSRFRRDVRNNSGLLAKADFRQTGNGWGGSSDRLHQHERVGAPYVRGRHDVHSEHVFRRRDHADRGADGNQDFQLACDDVGRETSFCDTDVVLLRVPFPISSGWTNWRDAGCGAIRLAATRLLFRRGTFSLRPNWRNNIRFVRRHVLLVSESLRQDDERDAR